MHVGVCQSPEGRDLRLINQPGWREVRSSSLVDDKKNTVAVLPLPPHRHGSDKHPPKNTQRPSNSYLSGRFKAISQREATSGPKRRPSRGQTRGHTGRLAVMCGPMGTAQARRRRSPSFTPLILRHCRAALRRHAVIPAWIRAHNEARGSV